MSRTVKILGWIYAILMLSFLLLPVIVIIPASFGGSELLEFPPRDLTTRWYESLVADTSWIDSTRVSLQISVATALLSTTIGLLIGIAHLRFGGISIWMRLLIMVPLLVPSVIIATGLFAMLLPIGGLAQIWPLVLVNSAVTLPIVTLLILAAFETIDPLLWTAASTLGARPFYILRTIIIPIVGASVVTACVLSFYNAWDETTFAIFVGPSVVPPLPSRLYAFLQQNVTPQVAAVATLLLVFTIIGGLLVLAMNAIRSRSKKSLAADGEGRTNVFETLHQSTRG